MKIFNQTYPLLTKTFRTIFGLSLLCCSFKVNAQNTADTAAVKTLLTSLEKYTDTYPSEKLYLNFDKPYYAVGDTAWFKAYVLKGDSKGHSDRSAKLYVELLDKTNSLVKRLVIPVFDGLAMGNLPLTEKDVPDGNYTVRAYTNWLQNFGADQFFYKQLSVGKLGGSTWLLSEQHAAGKGADSGQIQLSMRLTNTQRMALVNKKVSIKILDDKKTLVKSDVNTDVQGSLNTKLAMPPKVDKKNLSIAIEDAQDKMQRIVFPFYAAAADGDIDLQFLPEGGDLIAGLYSKVGFKAIGEDGLGRDVTGSVFNSKGEEVALLKTRAKGLGSFMMVAQAGETYTAKIRANDKLISYKLPAPTAQGLALRVDGVSHDDQVYVYLSSAVPDDKQYTLIARSRDKVYMGSAFKLNGEGYFNTRINKELLPAGIVNLMVIGPDNKPVAQRTLYNHQANILKLSTGLSATTFVPRDSIAISLQAAKGDGSAAQGSFSVAVTDDAQIQIKGQVDNIISRVLLTSELKGHIEDATWYFTPGDEKLKKQTLDDLLLTQGWQGFDLDKAMKPVTEPLFRAETEVNSVQGNLKTLFNKPAVGLKVNLLSTGKEFFLADTLSDAAGKFAFKDLPLTDSVAYLIKLHNKNNKTAAAAINVDRFKPTLLKLPALPRTMPWNFNADTTLLGYIAKNQQRVQANDPTAPKGTTMLKQVSIAAKRNIQQVNGESAVEVDAIKEEKLLEAGKMTLIELLERELKGSFRLTNLYALSLGGDADGRVTMRPTKQFVVGAVRINDIVVDGQSLGEATLSLNIPTASHDTPYTDRKTTFYGTEKNPADADFASRVKDMLNQLSADDVKGITVFRGRFLSVAINTRSGKGISSASSVGTYAYRPMPIQLPTKFYRPKYDAKVKTPDLRSTIHWEPNLVTDGDGKANLSFYAADKPGTYTVIIEGTDMQGNFGYTTQKITVGKPDGGK